MADWKPGGNFDSFHSLDAEKQKRIINVALVEFAEKGFQRASTNTIAKKAQIGKGMLFYYFGSKRELFDYLCEYTIEFTHKLFSTRFSIVTGDFLERYSKLTELKRTAMANYPEIMVFFESFYQEENAPYFEEFAKEIETFRQSVFSQIYADLDYSLFRQDLDGPTMVHYIKWLFEGYEADLVKRLKSGESNLTDQVTIDLEWKMFYEFIDDLRRIFYEGGIGNGDH